MKRVNSADAEEIGRVANAGNDIRYVPREGRLQFCGLAHEARYAWLLRHFPLQGKSVLDLGCGSGYGASMMAAEAETVRGVDYCKEAVAFAQKAYARENLDFRALDACRAEDMAQVLRPGGYAMIVSFDVIEHMERYFDYLENVRRLLADDGLFLLSTPNRLQTFNWNRTWNPYHFQEFSPCQLRKLLALYFPTVHLIAQDFRDEAKRETVRSELTCRRSPPARNPLIRPFHRLWRSTVKRISPAREQRPNLEYSDMTFLVEPGNDALEKAFGLVAVCARHSSWEFPSAEIA